MRNEGNFKSIKENRYVFRAWVDKPERKRPPEVVDVERVILKWILKTYDYMAWTGLIGLKKGTRSGLLQKE